ncbi:MAG TPA: glycoside hydrolase family 38 C-terminal domain-containing protein [bacterium]|nr:glycoside hydrolase family 38 C-terminal domain-containing protein [bacterium]
MTAQKRLDEIITAHIVSHNHWDREWIFRAHYVNQLIPSFMENLVRMMDRYPSYKFVLDGQTLILEDYFDQLPPVEAREIRKKLRGFVEEGRLLIGPAYLQPDWGLVSGEALVRNLLIGMRMAEDLGGAMKVGWMLDNFGQIAQAPQILRGFGIDGAFVWRGVDMPPDDLRTEFWWESPDGSRILGIYLLDSYRNAMVLSLTKEIAIDRISTHTHVLAPFASTPNVLLMNGYEQVPWPDDVLPIIEAFNKRRGEGVRLFQSTPPEYLETIRSYEPDLPVLGGYLYSGKYMPILKGVFSSRSHLIGQNNECQRELIRWAEPFSTLAWVFGSEYPERTLLRTWKTLLLNHTHDDVCGCSVDSIARDMQDRFARVRQTAGDLAQRAFRNITQIIDTSRDENALPLVVFNPSSRRRGHVFGMSMEIPETFDRFSITDSLENPVPYQIVSRLDDRTDLYLFADDVPSLGYKTYYVVPGEQQTADSRIVAVSEDGRCLENDFQRVTINDDGSLNIHCKSTNEDYTGLGYFEDSGDSGDTYDYSYPPEERIINSLNHPAKIQVVESGPLLARVRVEITLDLPKSLTPDRTSRTEETAAYPIVTFVDLTADSHRVEVHTFVRNTVKDHRLRILFPTDINTDHSYVEAPFDIAYFPIDTDSTVPEKPEKMQDLLIAGHDVTPVDTHIMQNFVGLADGKRGLTIASNKMGEYEILTTRSTVAITLIRSVGWLARADLLTRVGDVGPHIFTPEAQEIGDHVFTYSIYPNRGDWLQDRPHFMSDNQNMKLRAVQTDVHEGPLPEEYSFFSWETEDQAVPLRMTGVKRAEQRDAVIMRFYNTTDDPVKGRLKLQCEVLRAFRTNLNEEETQELPVQENTVEVSARGKEIITLKFIVDSQADLYKRATEATKMLPELEIAPRFPSVDFPQVITKEEVEAERERFRDLQRQLTDIRNKAYCKEDEIERKATRDLAKLAELQDLKTKVSALTRQQYEARVSVLENEQLYWMYKLEQELGEIGEELNWARTKKRVYEYLSNYYQIQLQRKNNKQSGDGI